MKVSFEWLCELAGVDDLTPQQAAELLTMAGWNVEGIEVTDLSAILVGQVVSQVPHPKSRNPLWIHQVDLGERTVQIIAGASNAVPGTLVPVALPGVTVPDGKVVRDSFNVGGFSGHGMLCSARELGLSEDHSGILVLEEGRPGQSLAELYPNDAVLEVDVTPNRPDCLGHLGLARELAAAAGRAMGRDFMPAFTGGVEPPGTELVGVRIDEPDLCRRYIGAVVRGVTVGPSPRWMQRRLRAAGVRPISNVVDVTNYVNLEYGQPLHAFDLAALTGPEIVVRRARSGEALLCLDGETRLLDEQTLVIADAERPVAIAGLIGGQETAVGAGTTDLLLEAANFDGVQVRATSRRLRLRTEASARFEKGISPELALAGARRAVQLLREVAGGEVHVGWPDLYPRPQEPLRVTILPEQIDRVLGTHVPLQEMEAILRRLDFQVRVNEAGTWDVLPPVFRLDVTMPEDVAEEVGRIHGYDKVPAVLPGRRRARWTPTEPSFERRLDGLRHVLTGAGLTEAVTPALLPMEVLDRLGIADRALRVLNPVADDMDALRTSLLPSLLRVATVNRHRGRTQVALFELARAYLRQPGDDGPEPQRQPQEPPRLGLLLTGLGSPDAGREGFLRLRAALERGAQALGVPGLGFERAEAPLFHPGRTARVLAAGHPVGLLGELHPSTTAGFDLEGRAVAAEIDLEALLERVVARRARPLPRFPAVDRDLAVVVAEEVEAGVLMAEIEAAAGDLLEHLSAFDEYRGAQVPEGRKSIAFSLVFRSPDRTLTDAEVDGRMAAIRAELAGSQGAGFRA